MPAYGPRGTPHLDSFTGDGTTVLTLGTSITTSGTQIVLRGGVWEDPANYTVNGARTQITLNTAISGAEVVLVYYLH